MAQGNPRNRNPRRVHVNAHAGRNAVPTNVAFRQASQYQVKPMSMQDLYGRRAPGYVHTGRRSRKRVFVGIFVVVVLAAVGAYLAFTLGAKHSAEPEGDAQAQQVEASQVAGAMSEEPEDTKNYKFGPDNPAPKQVAIVEHDEDDRAAVSSSDNEEKPGKKVVYLTFDDGPSTNCTPQLLDVLDEYGVKATWFTCAYPGELDKVKELWKRGHQVGLHSNSHRYDKIYASSEAFFADMDEIGNAVSERLGFVPTMLRFPGGSYSNYNRAIADELIDGVKARGWHYFDWNVSTGDATNPMTQTDVLVENIKNGTEGYNSCCVLMHDADTKQSTVDSLSQIIEYFAEQGYAFDYLSPSSFGYHYGGDGE